MTSERVELGPGVWSINGELHIDAVAVCEAAGYAPTPRNQATLVKAAEIVFSREGIPLEVGDER